MSKNSKRRKARKDAKRTSTESVVVDGRPILLQWGVRVGGVSGIGIGIERGRREEVEPMV